MHFSLLIYFIIGPIITLIVLLCTNKSQKFYTREDWQRDLQNKEAIMPILFLLLLSIIWPCTLISILGYLVFKSFAHLLLPSRKN